MGNPNLQSNEIADVNVQYSGEKASNLVQKISEQLDLMVKAHGNALKHFETVKSAFSGSPEIENEFENIKVTENNEVEKECTEISNIVAGLNNINLSWMDVSNSVLNALKKFNSGSEDSGSNQP